MTELSPEARSRDQRLDHLRGVAALLVAVNHGLEALWPAFFRWQGSWLSLGRVGVVLFFLISGYLFASPSLQGDRVMFPVRRALRIMPTYLAALVCFVAVGLVVDNRALSPGELLANISLTQTVLGFSSIVPPAWTLPVEVMFYVSVWLGIPAGRRWFTGGVVLWLAVAVVVALAALGTGKDLPSTVPLLIALAFLGGLVRHAEESPRSSPLPRCLFAAGLVLVLVAVAQASGADALDIRWTPFGYGFSTALGVILFLVSRRLPPVRTRVLTWLGAVSYSMYLSHPLVLRAARELPFGPWASFILYAAGVPLAAYLLYRAAEQPSLRASRNLTQALLRRRAHA